MGEPRVEFVDMLVGANELGEVITQLQPVLAENLGCCVERLGPFVMFFSWQRCHCGFSGVAFGDEPGLPDGVAAVACLIG